MQVLRCLTVFAGLSAASNAISPDQQRGTVTNVHESSGSMTNNVTVGSSTGTNSAEFAVAGRLAIQCSHSRR